MKLKSMLLMLLAGSSFFFMACPLRTGSPITGDTPTKPPSWLYGIWTDLSDSSTCLIEKDPSGPDKLKIYGVNSKTLAVDKRDLHPAVVSIVKGQAFISVYHKGDGLTTNGYYHFALGRASSGDLQLVPLDEGIVPAEGTGQELAEYIGEHADEPDEYYRNTEEIQLLRKRR